MKVTEDSLFEVLADKGPENDPFLKIGEIYSISDLRKNIIGYFESHNNPDVPELSEVGHVYDWLITVGAIELSKPGEAEQKLGLSDFVHQEMGVLLDKDHEEYEEYRTAWDKRYSYFDEGQAIYEREKVADVVKEVDAYVRDGVEGTYGIVAKTPTLIGLDKQDVEIDEYGMLEYFESSSLDYDKEDILYSVAKIDGEIKKDFITPAENIELRRKILKTFDTDLAVDDMTLCEGIDDVAQGYEPDLKERTRAVKLDQKREREEMYAKPKRDAVESNSKVKKEAGGEVQKKRLSKERVRTNTNF